jgi:hypothetical protein
LRFLVGQVEQVPQVATDGDLAAMALHLRQTFDSLLQRRLETGDIGPGTRQQRTGAAILLFQQGQ